MVRDKFNQLQNLCKGYQDVNTEEERVDASEIARSSSSAKAKRAVKVAPADSRLGLDAVSSDLAADSEDAVGGLGGQAPGEMESVARLTIRSLLHHLPLCTDARQILVGELFLESVFPAYMLNGFVLQHVALSSVIHSMQHGLSGNEGFSFAMVGASLLANPIDDSRFVAADAQEWGKLGLELCLRYNNQQQYCRTLMANALFINSFTGHLERSILELYQVRQASCRDWGWRWGALLISLLLSLAHFLSRRSTSAHSSETSSLWRSPPSQSSCCSRSAAAHQYGALYAMISTWLRLCVPFFF
jgi:hypothetical protein